MSENKANSLWLRALGRKILALKILTKYIYISGASHKKFFFVISPRVLNSYSSNIQDIFFCQTDINIYKHVSISYASHWERQMVFMEFDWKMTHTSFFRRYGTHRVRTWWWQEIKTPIKSFLNSKLFKLEKTEQNHGFNPSSTKPSLEGLSRSESKVLSLSLSIRS